MLSTNHAKVVETDEESAESSNESDEVEDDVNEQDLEDLDG